MRSLILLALAAACVSARPAAHDGLSRPVDHAPASAPASAASAPVELVESWPLETTLDHADLRDAADVWPEMIDAARARIDIAEFYVSIGPRLEPVIRALEAAAARGVRVRLLADKGFHQTYPETIDRLGRHGAQVRLWDVRKLTGGVLHAKYFVVDGREAYLGSQNLDWRSLEHIQELGVRYRLPDCVRALEDIFETDWAIAGGGDPQARSRPSTPYEFGEVVFVASPRGLLPDEHLWDERALVELLDSARRTIRVQLLTYRASVPDLLAALQRAQARGVKVEILLSNWALRHTDELRGLPGELRILSFPLASSGFIPFARVAHAKYCVVDGERAWVGTSNWERDYFEKSRNVGLIFNGGPFPARLDAFFEGNWESRYASAIENAPAPRIGN